MLLNQASMIFIFLYKLYKVRFLIQEAYISYMIGKKCIQNFSLKIR